MACRVRSNSLNLRCPAQDFPGHIADLWILIGSGDSRQYLANAGVGSSTGSRILMAVVRMRGSLSFKQRLKNRIANPHVLPDIGLHTL